MGMPPFLARIRAKVGTDPLLLPGVSAIVLNDGGELLLMRRSDTGRWALPAGHVEPGEEPGRALVREVYEETGLKVRPVGVAAVFGRIRVTFPNGDESEYVTTTFRCAVVGGALGPRDAEESLDAGFFGLDSPQVGEAMQRYNLAVHDFVSPGTSWKWDEAWLDELD